MQLLSYLLIIQLHLPCVFWSESFFLYFVKFLYFLYVTATEPVKFDKKMNGRAQICTKAVTSPVMVSDCVHGSQRSTVSRSISILS